MVNFSLKTNHTSTLHYNPALIDDTHTSRTTKRSKIDGVILMTDLREREKGMFRGERET
jgi:hypothetical protein